MVKLLRLKLMLLLCALVAASGSVWAETVTYTFTSKTWYATLNGESANWTSGKEGGGFSNNGIQVTTAATGANATSPVSYSNISKIVVTYNTNKSAGAGTLGIKIGDNDETTKSWGYSGSSDGRTANFTLQFDYETPQSGKVKITANTTTNSIYVVSIAITYTDDPRADAGLAYNPESVTLKLDETFTAPTFSNPNNLTVSYSSDNADVATVATNGTISFVGGLGTAVITASFEGNDEYKAGVATFTINVIRKTTTLNVSEDLSMSTGMSKAVSTLYTTNSDGEVTLTSNKTNIVSIEDGQLKALATGTATITVNVAQSDTYAAAESKSFKVTVTENAAVTPSGDGVGSGYTLVTDASTLKDGDKILIVGSTSQNTYAMSTTQNTSNRASTVVTVSNNAIASISNIVQVITLEGSTGAWYFNVSDGYLYAASSSSNQLKTKETKDDNAKATISINSSGEATVEFQGTNTHNLLKFNSSSNNYLFSCYTTGQSPIKIYRENLADSYDIKVSEAGWRTLVSALDVTLPEGLTAYTAKVNGDNAILTPVTEIAKNHPYLLEGNAGTYTLTKASTDVVAPTNNDLAISDATTGNGVFVLAKKNGEVGFYKWNGGYIGAGRVYLPSSAAAREFIGFAFDDEPSKVETVQLSSDSSQLVYDLQGRLVAQPAKGLYIVNGKKVVIK